MDNNKVEQSDIVASGDVGGRDINKPSYHFNSSSSKSTYLRRLYNKYDSEVKQPSLDNGYIDEFDYYNTKVKSEEIIGLEPKLTIGGFEEMIWYATQVKERYHKKLMRTAQFSETGQKIHAYILSAIRSKFMTEVYPLICDSKDKTLINTLINERIINPIIEELDENLLNFNHDELQGMLYFLTGNCHIKWSK